MNRLLVGFLALIGLAACTNFGDTESYQGMLFDSETCRSAAATELASRGLVNTETSRDRDALFENSYRKCMAARGYELPPESAASSLD